MRLRSFIRLLSEFKVWLGMLAYFGLAVSAYAYAFIAPTIIQSFGYGPIETQLRSVGPWLATLGVSLATAYVSDRMRHRCTLAVVPMFGAVAGLGTLLVGRLYGADVEVSEVRARFAALFLVVMGTYTAMPIVVCWFQMNLGGHRRRSMGSAFQIGFGNIGGFVAAWAFLDKDWPVFRNGFTICIAFQVVALLAAAGYATCVVLENKRRWFIDPAVLTEEEKDSVGVSLRG